MRYLSLLLFVFLQFSCAPGKQFIIAPLKGTYQDKPYEIKTNKSFDEVWDKLIDLFATKGLSIRVIDRSSGLLVSGRTAVSVTRENSKGEVYNKTASIVVPSLYNKTTRKWTNATGDGDVIGEWNVRLKKDGAGTLVNVNIVNIQYTSFTYIGTTPVSKESMYYDARSTGVFEKMISDIITQ